MDTAAVAIEWTPLVRPGGRVLNPPALPDEFEVPPDDEDDDGTDV